jgi:two-component sensor histidine kinase
MGRLESELSVSHQVRSRSPAPRREGSRLYPSWDAFGRPPRISRNSLPVRPSGLQGDGAPYGVLEVDSRSEGEFSQHDIAFLQGAANILGMAIERQRYEGRLKAALDRHQILLKEITHRVKNSLQVVTSMLRLQASASDDVALAKRLDEASSRVSAVGGAYERLAYDENVEMIALDAYLKDVCADAVRANSDCRLDYTADSTVRVDADRAIPIALITNELIANAARHASSEGSPPGRVSVRLSEIADATLLRSVSDNGRGLPADFDMAKSKGLGMRVVIALTKQLGGKITRRSSVNGTDLFCPSPPLTQDTIRLIRTFGAYQPLLFSDRACRKYATHRGFGPRPAHVVVLSMSKNVQGGL